MVTKTEGTTILDLVKYEMPNFSRENRLVDESQTLVLGAVVREGPENRLQAISVPVDEVQTIGITGTLTAGTFTLQFVDDSGNLQITDPIAYNAITSAIQTGVDTALGASKVTVAGTAITAMTFTFDGVGYTLKPQTLIEVDLSDLAGEEDATVTRTTAGGGGAASAGADAVQTLALVATAGTYTISIIDDTGTKVTTAALAYNASNAAQNTAIDLVITTGALVASGTAQTAQVMTFSGAGYKKRPQPLLEFDLSLLTYSSFSIVHTTVGSSSKASGPVGVVLAAVTTASGAKTTRVATLMRHAVLNKAYLDVGTANMNDTIAELAALGIIVRDEDGYQLTGA